MEGEMHGGEGGWIEGMGGGGEDWGDRGDGEGKGMGLQDWGGGRGFEGGIGSWPPRRNSNGDRA